MLLSDFDYHLPKELIAQDPAEPRDSARLMVFDRSSKTLVHARVRDLPSILPKGTMLTANNSRVRHSRLQASLNGKPTEILVVEPAGPDTYRCLLRGKGIKDGTVLPCYQDASLAVSIPLQATVLRREDVPGMTTFVLSFQGEGSVETLIERYGSLPLPPYITRSTAEESRYQTVFAKDIGSAAAPTAGLHFTPELIDSLLQAGFSWEEVTLHVGLGTFLPLRHETVEENRLHTELTHVSSQTAARIAAGKKAGNKLLAIGTTSLRTLESHSGPGGLEPGWKETDMFIYPGYRFQAADALLTNFHLPKSSLLLLVAAFLGTNSDLTPADMAGQLQALYKVAVEERYRFFSFGDAMLIL